MPASKSTNDKKALQQLYKNAIVINGHGSKTNQVFKLKDQILLTPSDLSKPYIFSVQPQYSIEKDLHAGKLKPIVGGKWTTYGLHSTHVPEVKIGPWKANETQHFAQQILYNQKLWSNVDGHKGYYLNHDPDAKLVLKQKQQFVTLGGDEAKKAFHKIMVQTFDYAKEGTPIFFYAPKVGKVKVLEKTSLSEILTQLNKLDAGKLVLLATCNAEKKGDPVVHLHDKGNDIAIEDLGKTWIKPRVGEEEPWLSKLQPVEAENKVASERTDLIKKSGDKLDIKDVLSMESSPLEKLLSTLAPIGGENAPSGPQAVVDTSSSQTSVPAAINTPVAIEMPHMEVA